MSPLEEHFPQPCPFCNIAKAYEAPAEGADTPNAASSSLSPAALQANVPTLEQADPTKVMPECFLVLSSPNVMAFLDIMPITRGHLLVTTRAHREKIEDVGVEESRDLGFYLPLLARTVKKVLNIADYNIVQNNGARAAQVVPHVHFHIIPRPTQMPELQNRRSWTMFGRGVREDLDESEAAELAATLRKALSEEIEALKSREKL